MLYLEFASCREALTQRQSEGYGFLSPAEAQRAESIVSLKRRDQFLAGRLLARRMLCRVYGGEPQDWVIRAEPGFPPVVEDFREARLSISHSRDWVACALSDQEVGIDVEAVKPERDTLSIAQMVCHPEEIAELETLTSALQAERFTQFWSLKEAWLKQRGAGLDLHRMRSLCALPSSPVDVQAITLRYEDATSCGMLAVASPEALTVQIEPNSGLHTRSLALWRFQF